MKFLSIHPKFLITTALTVLLAACGGGGSSSPTNSTNNTVPIGPVPAAIDQGRWTNIALAPGYTAIVQHKANTASSLWLLANDASVMGKLSLSGSGAGGTSGSATGKVFTLGTTNSAAVAGTFSAGSGTGASSNVKTLTLSQVLQSQAAPLELTAKDTMAAALTTAQASSNWSATATGLNVTWSVNSAGAISGSSTTGCAYSGQLSPAVGIGLYETTFSEVCAGTANTYSGIATVNGALTQMTVVATTAGDAKAALLLFAKSN